MADDLSASSKGGETVFPKNTLSLISLLFWGGCSPLFFLPQYRRPLQVHIDSLLFQVYCHSLLCK